MSNHLETISLDSLHLITGGAGAPAKKPPTQPKPQPKSSPVGETHGNPIQQGAQMIDHAATGFSGARKAGASWYESAGNAAIHAFGLSGGFDANGKPR